MKYLLVCLFLSTVFIHENFAINPKNNRSKKKQMIELADSAFFAENFAKSLDLYDEILKNYPSNHYVQYHRYVAYHLSSGRGKDVDLIYEYEQNEGHVDKFYNYWLGRIHYYRYEFDIAKEHFQAFLEVNAYKSAEIKKETEQYLEKIEKAKRFHNNPDSYQIVPLGGTINSEYADLSPAFFGNHNELLFVSSRPDDETQKSTNDFRIFHAKKDDQEWKAPSVIHRLGVFDKDHAKIEVVNQDGKLFMFLNGKDGGLHYSEPKDGRWTLPMTFDSQIDEKTLDSHFFINDSEDVVYISAKQPGNRLDLLESRFNEGLQAWSKPVPLKGEINSRYDDDSPFLSHDGKYLYFSSNRRGTLGGYDVFRSEYDESANSWSKAENMGFPINTIDDEINFQLNEDNISGFFSSNRLHSVGDYDIYYFHKARKVLANGKVMDRKTGMVVPEINVQFHPTQYTDESFLAFTNSQGEFEVEIFENEDFIVEISLDGQTLFTTQITSFSEELHRSFSVDFLIDIPSDGNAKTDFFALYEGNENESEYSSMEMLGNKFRTGQKAVLKNIYFDFRSYQLKENTTDALNQILAFLQSSPETNLEISGHTDNIGTEESNRYISQKRAESIKEALVKMGVSSNRLLARGYGESQPLASNDDEENGRELNRRIEVKILD